MSPCECTCLSAHAGDEEAHGQGAGTVPATALPGAGPGPRLLEHRGKRPFSLLGLSALLSVEIGVSALRLCPGRADRTRCLASACGQPEADRPAGVHSPYSPGRAGSEQMGSVPDFVTPPPPF